MGKVVKTRLAQLFEQQTKNKRTRCLYFPVLYASDVFSASIFPDQIACCDIWYATGKLKRTAIYVLPSVWNLKFS